MVVNICHPYIFVYNMICMLRLGHCLLWSELTAVATTLQATECLQAQGEHSDIMYIVESGVITCHVDFLRLHHRMRLPVLSQDVLAVAPVRYTACRALTSLQALSLHTTVLAMCMHHRT